MGAIAYERFKDTPGFTRVVTREEIRAKDGNLSIPLWVAPAAVEVNTGGQPVQIGLADSLNRWIESSTHSCAALGSLPLAASKNQLT